MKPTNQKSSNFSEIIAPFFFISKVFGYVQFSTRPTDNLQKCSVLDGILLIFSVFVRYMVAKYFIDLLYLPSINNTLSGYITKVQMLSMVATCLFSSSACLLLRNEISKLLHDFVAFDLNIQQLEVELPFHRQAHFLRVYLILCLSYQVPLGLSVYYASMYIRIEEDSFFDSKTSKLVAMMSFTVLVSHYFLALSAVHWRMKMLNKCFW